MIFRVDNDKTVLTDMSSEKRSLFHFNKLLLDNSCIRQTIILLQDQLSWVVLVSRGNKETVTLMFLMKTNRTIQRNT